MLAEFSIYPMDTGHQSRDVAKVVEILQATGLEYRMGPMSTAVEGELEQVLVAVRRCYQAVAKNHDRVITTLVLDDRKDQPHRLGEMGSNVERRQRHRLSET